VAVTTGSLLSCVAMFYLAGASLRWTLALSSALWLFHAWSYHSWWQIVGNVTSGAAAAYGALLQRAPGRER
jgi:hypothetical protein